MARADRETYADRLRLIEAAVDDIPPGEMAVLRVVYELLDEQLTVAGADVAARLGKTQPQIAPAAQRLERRASYRATGGAGGWRTVSCTATSRAATSFPDRAATRGYGYWRGCGIHTCACESGP